MAAVEAGITDRALIIGSNVIEQVVALAAAGCRSVLSLRAGASCPRGEPVDILWLAGTDDALDILAAASRSGTAPRVVVIEMSAAEAERTLRPLTRQLRAMGFVRVISHRTNSGIAVVAARPSWLRQIH